MPSCISDCNMEIITPVDMDPSRCKRADYAPGLANAALPSQMAPKWEELARRLRDLYSKLGNHEAMRPNLTQTFNTPANSRNQVYFMWDFVGRTLHQVYLTPASLQRMNSAHQERWMDVQGRATMAAMLILGKLPGGDKLLAGNTNVVGEQPKFGVDVDNAAKAILGEA